MLIISSCPVLHSWSVLLCLGTPCAADARCSIPARQQSGTAGLAQELIRTRGKRCKFLHLDMSAEAYQNRGLELMALGIRALPLSARH